MSASIKRIDAKGLPCPQPVILVKKALEEGGFDILEVIVDNDSARENVSRFAGHEGCSAEEVGLPGGLTRIRIRLGDGARGQAGAESGQRAEFGAECGDSPEGAAVPEAKAAPSPSGSPAAAATIFISSAFVGSGDDELGALLMKGFISTLLETSPLPERIIFMNGGVKLAIQGSTALEKLAALAGRGVEILSCGTCLDFYKVKDKLAVGRVTNMFEIASLLMKGSVLSL